MTYHEYFIIFKTKDPKKDRLDKNNIELSHEMDCVVIAASAQQAVHDFYDNWSHRQTEDDKIISINKI